MLNRLINTKLSTKALLATMIPFLINVGWLFAMWSNSQQTENLGTKERQQANLVERINLFTQQYYDLEGSFMTAFYTATKGRLDLYERSLRAFHEAITSLMADPGLLEQQKATLTKLKDFAEFQNKFLKEGLEDNSESRWHMFIQYRRVFLAGFKNRFEDTSTFTEFLLPQRQELDRLRKRLENQQKIFIVILVAGVSSNLVVALFVHYLFRRYVTRQVDGLVSNARALSQKKILLRPLHGEDDFAVVDAALHQSQKELAEAFAYRQTLMQMIAHDLKSPLAASQVSLALVLEREQETLNERGIKILNKVVSNNMRLLSLISDLLTIDALELGHLELAMKSHSVGKCVQEASETLSSLATAKGLTIVNGAGEQEAIFDYARILQVVVNLLSNAIKFSRKGSEIRVTCEASTSEEVIVQVTDLGAGIAEKDQSMIFQKYFQTEDGKRAAGTGLGLAICKLIVESHGQKIGFKSATDKGTTFWFTLKKSSSANTFQPITSNE